MKLFKNRFLSNVSWIIGGRIFQMAISLFIGMITARYLGPSNYGIINYVASFVAFFTSLSTLGLNGIIIKELVADPKNQGTIIGSTILMRIVSSIISTITILIIILIINPNDNLIFVVAILQSISLVFQSFNTIDFWYQSKLQSKKSTIIQSTAYLIIAIYKVVILIIHKDVKWFAFSTTLDIILIALMLLISYFRNNGQKLRFSLSLSKKLLSQSYHFIISGVMVAVFAQTDKIMIGKMMDITSVGLYSVAIVISGLWGLIPSAMIDSARPVIMLHKGQNQKLYIKRLKQLYAAIIWLNIAYCTFVTCFSNIIIFVLYGAEYANARGALIIAVWYGSFAYLGAGKNIWLICEGKSRYEKIFTFLGAITNVFLNLILIPIMGINGAAIATLITQATTNFIIPLLFKDTRINSMYMVEAFLLRDVISKDRIKKFFNKVRNRQEI